MCGRRRAGPSEVGEPAARSIAMATTWPPRTVIRKSSGLRTLESALYRSGLGR
ncbi:ribonuclease HII domain protein [Mycobacterium xenopi 3993]|nr:ribonuclease HII domain protein [Mycobacterium xenopi 3993]